MCMKKFRKICHIFTIKPHIIQSSKHTTHNLYCNVFAKNMYSVVKDEILITMTNGHKLQIMMVGTD